jgi:hypothetical protein
MEFYFQQLTKFIYESAKEQLHFQPQLCYYADLGERSAQTIAADLLTLTGFCSELAADCGFDACAACFLARVSKSWVLVAS